MGKTIKSSDSLWRSAMVHRMTAMTEIFHHLEGPAESQLDQLRKLFATLDRGDQWWVDAGHWRISEWKEFLASGESPTRHFNEHQTNVA